MVDEQGKGFFVVDGLEGGGTAIAGLLWTRMSSASVVASTSSI